MRTEPSLLPDYQARDVRCTAAAAAPGLTLLLRCAAGQALRHGLMHARHSQQLQLQAADGGATTTAAAGAILVGLWLLDQVDVPAEQQRTCNSQIMQDLPRRGFAGTVIAQLAQQQQPCQGATEGVLLL